jgi:hypothetical protein
MASILDRVKFSFCRILLRCACLQDQNASARLARLVGKRDPDALVEFYRTRFLKIISGSLWKPTVVLPVVQMDSVASANGVESFEVLQK